MVRYHFACERIQELCEDLKNAKAFNEEMIFQHRLESLRNVIRHLSSDLKQDRIDKEREDSAFFDGELTDEKEVKNEPFVHVTKEKEDSADCVAEFRKRRQNRLDARSDEEEGRWVTTENDHKIHINEEGVPDKGNPFRS